MLLLNFMIILLLFIGLLCTLAPRLHGALIIGVVGSGYAMLMGVNIFQSWVGVSLLVLLFIGEVGAGGLRIILTRHADVTRIYSVDTTVCNLAGLVVTDALLGSLVGMLIWEGLVGKNLLPRLDSIGKVLMRLIIIAALRLLCGIMMISIVIMYIMYRI